MVNKTIIGIIIFLLTGSNVQALQTDEYLNHVTDLVYDSCKGNDIKLKENFFIKSDNSSFGTELKWPYDRALVKETLNYISESEPYAESIDSWFSYTNVEVGGKSVRIDNRGYNILACGENHLDVFTREYDWKMVER